jgi:hypothetical protein
VSVLSGVFLLGGQVGIAQQTTAPSAATEIRCSMLLSMTNDDDAFAIRPNSINANFEMAGTTLLQLTDRVGTENVRARLGITARDEHDPLFAGQMMAALNTLSAYNRRYCADHPLDTLQGAVDGLVAQFSERKVSETPSSTTQPSVESLTDKLHSIAAATTKAAPTMLDATTRLDGAQADSWVTLQFNYTLTNVNARSVGKAAAVNRLEGPGREAIRRGVCSSQLKEFLAAGATLRYSYRDQNDELLAKIQITSADCAEKN